LRIAFRTRQSAHIDNQLDSILLKQRNEDVDLARGMANRPKSHVNKKGLFALTAILLIIGIAGAIRDWMGAGAPPTNNAIAFRASLHIL
jgi:hypothetical protein